MMTMKSCLSGPFLLLLLLLLLSSAVSGSVVFKHYQYNLNYVTWQEAQHHCRSSGYIDLAIIYTQSDTDQMHMHNYVAWIGLHRRGGILTNDWVWSDGLDISHNHDAWAEHQPYSGSNCAVASSNKKFYGNDCEGYAFFICHKRRSGNRYDYTFIPQVKTWSEAQQYCRDQYHDLATFETASDLSPILDSNDFPVWIGLHRNGGTWKWSAGLSQYQHWASGEPGENGDCISISSSRKNMTTQNCSARFPYVCFTNNLVLVKENKTWEEALEHCRTLQSPHDVNVLYDLISVQPGEDHNYIMNTVMEANTDMVWTGLCFLAGHWVWTNGVNVAYPDLPLCPPEEQRCGALSQNNTGSVVITDCLERRNFLCYRSGW